MWLSGVVWYGVISFHEVWRGVMHVDMMEMMRNREKKSIGIECLYKHMCARKLLKVCRNEIKQGGRKVQKYDNRR